MFSLFYANGATLYNVYNNNKKHLISSSSTKKSNYGYIQIETQTNAFALTDDRQPFVTL